MDKAENKTVLVVEDEPDVQAFLAATLEDAGFNVVTASNGQEAYNCVKESKPDAITLDLVMPRQSGVTFYKRLRANAKYTGIPVVIITAHARDDLGHEDFNEVMKGKDVTPPKGTWRSPWSPSTSSARLPISCRSRSTTRMRGAKSSPSFVRRISTPSLASKAFWKKTKRPESQTTKTNYRRPFRGLQSVGHRRREADIRR